jgi:hypothetical protein
LFFISILCLVLTENAALLLHVPLLAGSGFVTFYAPILAADCFDEEEEYIPNSHVTTQQGQDDDEDN